MSYPTKKQISLDIYNNNIVYFNAKQGDAGSRYVEITCTENGKKIVIDQESAQAYIKFKKPDGKYGLNHAEVLSNGCIYFELTQQMLAVSGRAQFDVLLFDSVGEFDFNEETGQIKVTDLCLLSTISFYVNVLSSTVDDTLIESSNEFSALTTTIAQSIATEKLIQENESERQENETDRQEKEAQRQDNITGEAYRIANENIRIQEELKRQDNITGEAYRIANENIRIQEELKRQDNITGEAYRIANEAERQRIFGKETDSVDDETMYGVMNSTKQLIEEGNDVIEETQSLLGTKDDSSDVDTLYGIQKALQESVVDGDKAVQRANEAAQKCEDVASGTGIVFTTDIANNLTTTETGKVLDATQGTELLAMINALQETISNMPKVYSGANDPDNSMGNNGDYYLKLLTEE